MKKVIALCLVIILFITSCAPIETSVGVFLDESIEETIILSPDNWLIDSNIEITFTNLGDPDLLRYLEDSVYHNIVALLDSDAFFVENVSAIFLSNEYLEQLAFNSLENIYFGYTLSELDAFFQGTRYIFNLDDSGQTVVQSFERYDDTFDRIVRNITIGTGVILLSVTVALVAPIAGASAVSLIFTKSATTGAISALTGGAFSGGIAGVVTGVTTGDINKALTAAALAASEGIKWGAITGSVFGGVQTAIALRGATKNGLTMNQAATLQRETRLPLDVIRQFHTMDEASFFVHEVGLRPVMINGRTTLARGDIDLNLIDELGRTNLQRMADGLNPLTATGQSFEWHHIGQRANGTLALLTPSEHDNPILHGFLTQSEINRTVFAAQRKATNSSFALFLQTGGIVQ